MTAPSTRTIMCNVVDNVLIPDPVGAFPVTIEESLNPDNSKIGKVSFGGGMQGFLTYGICNTRPVAYSVSAFDPMGYIHKSFENLIRMF